MRAFLYMKACFQCPRPAYMAGGWVEQKNGELAWSSPIRMRYRQRRVRCNPNVSATPREELPAMGSTFRVAEHSFTAE